MSKQKRKSLSLGRGLRAALLRKDVGRRAELEQLNRADLPSRGRNDALPELELVMRSPNDLRAPERNVRSINQSHVKRVINSIAELGFDDPLTITPDGEIIDGVIRKEAALAMGLEAVPCIVAKPLSQKEKRLLRLAINRLSERGSWDVENLTVEWRDLVIDDTPIEVTGFDTYEVDALLAVEPTIGEVGPLEPDDQPTIARVGDVFLLGRHRLVCGDARQPSVLTTLMADQPARLVLTDQPYNKKVADLVSSGDHTDFVMASGELNYEDFQAFTDDWIAVALPHLRDGGILITFIDWGGLPVVLSACLSAGLTQINLAVWVKKNAGMGSLFRSRHELAPLFKKGTTPHTNNVKLGANGRSRTNVWDYAGASSLGSDARAGLTFHPTVKPVAMLADAILDLTEPDDVVLDPFLGSGSTLIAAEKTGRICHGVELDPKYVDVILRRYHNVTGHDGRLKATGESFPELVKARTHAPAEKVSGSPPQKAAPTRGRDRPARRAA